MRSEARASDRGVIASPPSFQGSSLLCTAIPRPHDVATPQLFCVLELVTRG